MDLACGKGRHSWALHQCDLQVTGMDLAPNSIALARQDYPQVRFEVGDMRSFDLDVRFEAVFNLFTSFGYFNGLEDNLKVLQCVHAHLQSGGCLVIDQKCPGRGLQWLGWSQRRVRIRSECRQSIR